MARIKFTAVVESIRGTIGGTTFQRNAYGYTAKSKPNMLIPWSQKQASQKLAMSTTAKAWRTLTEANRDQWNTYAENNPRPSRLNPDAYLSGYNLFMLYNRYAQLASLSVLASPSLILTTLGEVTGVPQLSAGVLHWLGDSDAFTGTWRVLLFLTNVIPFGREFVNVTPRFITSYALVAGGTDTIITAPFIAALGTLPPVGQWIGLKMVIVNTVTAQVIVQNNTQVQVI